MYVQWAVQYYEVVLVLPCKVQFCVAFRTLIRPDDVATIPKLYSPDFLFTLCTVQCTPFNWEGYVPAFKLYSQDCLFTFCTLFDEDEIVLVLEDDSSRL